MTVLFGAQLTTMILELESVAGPKEPGLMAVCFSYVKTFAKTFWVFAWAVLDGF